MGLTNSFLNVLGRGSGNGGVARSEVLRLTIGQRLNRALRQAAAAAARTFMVEAASALFAKCSSPRGRVSFAPKSPCALNSGGVGEISRVSRAFVKSGKKGTRFPRDDDDGIEWAAITETPFQLRVV